ncbi:MAG: PD40 domain-containing protein, partial [Bacteroidales bacterium]|nr:PD40 domain-containing protein [Bacteroidales bacterium]
MKIKLSLSVLLLLLVANLSYAQENPRWLRQSAISPDGKTVAFAFQGDIFTVSSSGGQALQITSSPSYDGNPIWSADGSKLVFSSYRDGSKDVWVVSSKGGTPRQLTTYTGPETPLAALSDGTVVYITNILPDSEAADYTNVAQIYKVPIDGGKSERV